MTLKREVEKPTESSSAVVWRAIAEGVADGLRRHDEEQRRDETMALWVSIGLAVIAGAVYLAYLW